MIGIVSNRVPFSPEPGAPFVREAGYTSKWIQPHSSTLADRDSSIPGETRVKFPKACTENAPGCNRTNVALNHAAPGAAALRINHYPLAARCSRFALTAEAPLQQQNRFVNCCIECLYGFRIVHLFSIPIQHHGEIDPAIREINGAGN